jgi:hypothetical protein
VGEDIVTDDTGAGVAEKGEENQPPRTPRFAKKNGNLETADERR